MVKKVLGPLIIGLLFLYFLTLVLHISANIDDYQWDFRTHREAGKIFASGSNPYNQENLFPSARTRFLYTYPPVTLFFYRLFSLVDYQAAFHIFLILKCILLLGLAYFWKREFLKKDADPFFYVFCLLAFNSAVFLDLIAGNINLVEQVMLWPAFCFYIRGRFMLFCGFVLLAAAFKMIPAFFLILLLLCDEPKKYRYFLGSAAAFLAYLLIQYAVAPDLFKGFIRNALEVVGESGEVVPSTFKLIGEAFQLIGKLTGITVPQTVQLTVLGIISAGIVLLTHRSLVRLKDHHPPETKMIAVFLVCLVYALIHPRFKDYMYLLLLVPSYYILKNIRFTQAAPFLFILFILSCRRLELPIAESLMELVWGYYPLMIAYCVWGLYLHEISA